MDEQEFIRQDNLFRIRKLISWLKERENVGLKDEFVPVLRSTLWFLLSEAERANANPQG